MDYEQALSRMAALCSVSEHCESEIRLKLQKAALSVDDTERVISRLYAEGYLNTERYCRAFAHDKLRFEHWGRVKIGQALHLKGLPHEDIRQALQDLNGEEYRQVLHGVLAQKAGTLHDEDERMRRAKLLRFAAGRGFSADEAVRAVAFVLES
ncbi:MAG: RecX family transcriptional regulator [Bacteroidales bacterium]|nr:RecX family transcriptional regulator [Bacteroidales bacterium]